jgi:hypothetical protein
MSAHRTALSAHLNGHTVEVEARPETITFAGHPWTVIARDGDHIGIRRDGTEIRKWIHRDLLKPLAGT